MTDKIFDQRVGARLQALREAKGLSLGDLAGLSGVSKAMIARVEKAQSSATAALLGRLCAGLGARLSSVIEEADRPSERVSRHAEQGLWRDPETGYLRRQISPSGAVSGIEIASIELPAGARIAYQAWAANAYAQQLLMLEGELHLSIGETHYRLQAGDCIDFDVQRANLFENRGAAAARYLIIIRKS
jgi:transcriptional regulator with XRE-family HTH domain